MSLNKCFDKAAAMKVITQQEADEFKKRYAKIAADSKDPAEVRSQMALEVEKEAAHRLRAAHIDNAVAERLWSGVGDWRNIYGRIDKAQAFVQFHENFGKQGTYVKDAEGVQKAIIAEAQEAMAQILKDFKRGAFTGDRRRQGNWVGNARVMARMENVVKELFGENSGDPRAKVLAEAWTKIADQLKERFNTAGGAIGDLDKWGLPQSHRADALLNAGMKAWVKYMMGDGVLDRDRMVHPLTKKKMSEADLQEALEVSWQRITTDGMIDQEIAMSGRGTGSALYTQHADHRFLHFKSPASWLAYQKEFGQPDVFATMMGHINTMARDIAHMETFGTNPNRVREYIKSKLRQEAAQMDTKEVMAREVETAIDGTREALAELTQLRSVTRPADLELARLRMEGLEKDLQALTSGWGRLMMKLDMMPDKTKAEVKAVMDAMLEAQRELSDAEIAGRGERVEFRDPTPEEKARDAELRAELQTLINDAVQRIEMGPETTTQRAHDYLNGRIERAEAMWELMRGAAPVNVTWAQRMASARNVVTAASLGGAFFSALSDSASGQFARQRFGMALGRSNAVRLLMHTLTDMITNAKRDDAVGARLGLDSAMHVMQQTARFGSIDMRHWTGFVADRVLTTTMLQPYTQAGKHLAGFDVMRFLASQREMAFRDLPDLTQKALKGHGFGELAWDQLRSVHPYDGLLRPNEIAKQLGREMAEKYTMMLHREIRAAVIEGTLESRSVVTGLQAGTVMGEAMRSMGQFKGYGLAVIFIQMRRIHQELMAGDRSMIGHATAFLITGAMLGAVAMMLKDLKDGRDPRRWLDEKTWLEPKMWAASLLQAGGLGIYGDLLFSDVNRFGGGIGETIAGPLGARVNTAKDILIQAPIDAMSGKPTKLGRNAVKAARQWTPGQNHWMLNQIPHVAPRVLFDKLQMMVDPDARTSFHQEMRKRQKDYGQGYFWPRGEPAPVRAPDFSRVLSTK